MIGCRLEAQATRFRLARPFVIARGTREAITLVTVTLHAQGVRGWGEGAPSARYDESPDSVLAQIEALRPRIEAGVTRAELATIMAPGAARNAIDCALWDLEAKLTGVPVAARLGAGGDPAGGVVTAVTLGIDTPGAMAARAHEIAADRPAGWPAPLLKIKLDGRLVTERVTAIREAAPDAVLIADANESWDMRTLETALPALGAARVALLEQPLPAGKDEALAGLGSPVPLAADESAHEARDVPRLAALYDYVTIKLDKSGGLTGAWALADAAQAAGMGVMTGCMLCSSLSVAAAWPIARRSRFVDLDGPLWLAQDRPGGCVLENGLWRAPVGLEWGRGGHSAP
ncbi:dipeptide epimerase [Novosphingobium profundi]|uniref:dipeptide epimerase n=1 Tax=Novosphingobium profundi TaxID=1774954 RepID=UPI0031B9E4E7